MVNCDKWFYTVLAILGLFFTWSIVIFRYYLRVDKKSVVLGKNDEQHEHKHGENVKRIIKLEEKNGKELAEIERLNGKITILEGIINKLIAQPKPIYTTPTPPPPPPVNKDGINGIKKPFNQQKHHKKGGWNEIHEAIKKRRKDLGEDNENN